MKYYAKDILLSDGWAKNQVLTIENGVITDIAPGKPCSGDLSSTTESIQSFSGAVIPGMVNCHSHAFQRAFAGFSEQGSDGQDSFWTWRKIMYKFLGRLDHNDAQVIASQLYIEMLKKGYTRVAEFHYLHHNMSGNPYKCSESQSSDLAKMAHAIFEAASHAGIGLTMLPVLYQYAGFGQKMPNEGQKRFINSTKQFNQLVSDCYTLSKQFQNTNVGIAPHSLRAADKDSIESAVKHIRTLDKYAPIHIHIAEQQQEVDDCLAHYKKRPVQWLLDNFEVDKHWCLIHATHITQQEQKSIVTSEAIVGICPTTEANLGDGIFPTAEFLDLAGTFAIGSDSHISISPVEELRWLEYAQRLQKQKRTILSNKAQKSVGQNLWHKAATGGAQSTSTNTGAIAVGKQADLLVLNEKQTRLFANNHQHILDSIIFASQENVVKDVMVNGCWVIQNNVHALEIESAENFAKLLKKLSAT